MFWLSRPPHLRRLAATVIVLVGLATEFLPGPTVSHPFALGPVEVGQTVTEADVEWRQVPRGLLAPVTLPQVAARAVRPGEPLLGGGVESGDDGGIPDGWWALELGVPSGARPGMAVRVVTGVGTADGLVIQVTEGDFGERAALVALPADHAERVAPAVLERAVMVLLGG